jgi:hypothetical protein
MARFMGIVCCLLGALQAVPASAKYFDGNKLLEFCQEPEESKISGICWGYIIGVINGIQHVVAYQEYYNDIEIDGFRISKDLLEVSKPFCIPDEVTRGQQINVAVEFLKTHPSERDKDVRFLISDALKEAFPCD